MLLFNTSLANTQGVLKLIGAHDTEACMPKNLHVHVAGQVFVMLFRGTIVASTGTSITFSFKRATYIYTFRRVVLPFETRVSAPVFSYVLFNRDHILRCAQFWSFTRFGSIDINQLRVFFDNFDIPPVYAPEVSRLRASSPLPPLVLPLALSPLPALTAPPPLPPSPPPSPPLALPSPPPPSSSSSFASSGVLYPAQCLSPLNSPREEDGGDSDVTMEGLSTCLPVVSSSTRAPVKRQVMPIETRGRPFGMPRCLIDIKFNGVAPLMPPSYDMELDILNSTQPRLIDDLAVV
jgi:hypothetical protein